jgi:lysozyme
MGLRQIENVRHATQRGIDFIKGWERYRKHPYDAGDGFLTGGYGHVFTAQDPPRDLNLEEAEMLLKKDLFKAECSIIRLVNVFLTDNQFDALVSFTFNVGGAAFQRSTLRMKINRLEFDDVFDEFLRWTKSGGRIMKGLVRRRKAEALLFLG